MYKTYIDGNLQNEDDVLNIAAESFSTISREDGVANTEQILRRKALDANLSLTGRAYDYVCSQIHSDRCKIFTVDIHNDCGVEANGTFTLPGIEWSPGVCTLKTPVKDNSFGAYLRDYMSADVPMYQTKSRNCVPITTVDRLFTMPYNPNNQTDVYQVKGYDVLDAIKYLVDFYTDKKFTVVSNFLSTHLYAFTTGYNMHRHGINATQIYPQISLERLFTEMRKKLRLYMGIEYDSLGVAYLRIEQESYFFEDTELLRIDIVPPDTVQKYDQARLFNRIEIGSDKTKLEDGSAVTYPQTRYNAWNKESYVNCGTCAADKDSKLDAVSEMIIDSNVIFEALNWVEGDDYTNDSELFLFEYYNSSGVPTGKNTLYGSKYYYNDSLRNVNVLANHIDYYNDCLVVQRSAAAGFLADFGISTLTMVDHPDVTGTNSVQNFLRWASYEYDNRGLLTNTSHDFGMGADPLTIFTCDTTGQYNFQAIAQNLKQTTNIAGIGESNVTYRLSIYTFTDNTFTTGLYAPFEISATVANAYTQRANLTIETDLIALSVGNVVCCQLYVEMPITNNLPGEAVTFAPEFMSFTLLEDNLTCVSVQNNENSRPFITTLGHLICWADWQKILANPRGYILLGGTKQWIKTITYKHEGLSPLELMGNEPLCGMCAVA